MVTISPTEDQLDVVLQTFLTSILNGIPVIKGQVNRVPEPKDSDYVVFWQTRRPRLSTNLDEYSDTSFEGSISGTTLTVTSVRTGTIELLRTLLGIGIADGTVISSQIDGTPGGIGNYVVSIAQNVSSEIMAAGAATYMQSVEVNMQLDVHGPAGTSNATIVSTLLRDEFAVSYFAAFGLPITPLYADDPQQLAFISGEDQYEDRWMVRAVLQVDETVTLSQQFADVVEVDLVNVDAVYPA